MESDPDPLTFERMPISDKIANTHIPCSRRVDALILTGAAADGKANEGQQQEEDYSPTDGGGW
jgi:hypothetical protein